MPTSDTLWTYNLTKHRWIPTILGASEQEDITKVYGDNETNVNRQLDSISRSVYNWAYARANSMNKNLIEYLFAFEMADVIKEAIMAQLEADVSQGFNDVKNIHGTNAETGMIMNRRELAQMSICLEAQQILLNARFVVGLIDHPLLAQYPFGTQMTADRYTVEGY